MYFFTDIILILFYAVVPWFRRSLRRGGSGDARQSASRRDASSFSSLKTSGRKTQWSPLHFFGTYGDLMQMKNEGWCKKKHIVADVVLVVMTSPPNQTLIFVIFFLYIIFRYGYKGEHRKFFKGGAKDRNKVCTQSVIFFEGFAPPLNSVRPPPLKAFFIEFSFFGGGGRNPQNSKMPP